MFFYLREKKDEMKVENKEKRKKRETRERKKELRKKKIEWKTSEKMAT